MVSDKNKKYYPMVSEIYVWGDFIMKKLNPGPTRSSGFLYSTSRSCVLWLAATPDVTKTGSATSVTDYTLPVYMNRNDGVSRADAL
jgi:hypothetical protein